MSAREILDLARAAGVDARTRVLDLCCGSGGPALHLARQTGCWIIWAHLVKGASSAPQTITLASLRYEAMPLHAGDV